MLIDRCGRVGVRIGRVVLGGAAQLRFNLGRTDCGLTWDRLFAGLFTLHRISHWEEQKASSSFGGGKVVFYSVWFTTGFDSSSVRNVINVENGFYVTSRQEGFVVVKSHTRWRRIVLLYGDCDWWSRCVTNLFPDRKISRQHRVSEEAVQFAEAWHREPRFLREREEVPTRGHGRRSWEPHGWSGLTGSRVNFRSHIKTSNKILPLVGEQHVIDIEGRG